MGIVSRDEVAKAAGVSSATVSRVYNSPASVSREKRKSVLEAAEKLGYIPNKSASALRRKGTGIITLLELKKSSRSYYWADLPNFKWFYSDMLHAVKSVIDGSMFQLNIATLSSAEDLAGLKGKTDGLVCFDVDEIREAEMVASSGLPYIIGHHTKSFHGFNRCSTDNFEGGRQQALLLKNRGCCNPVYITAHLDQVKPHRERLDGFMSVYPEARVLGEGVGREFGYRAAVKITGKTDGIAAVNDITAAGAGYALMEAGIGVQTETALAGYDNMPLNAALPFSLLSVDLQPERIYEAAARMLLGIINNPKGQESMTIQPRPVGIG